MRIKYAFIAVSLLVSLFIYLFYRTDRTVVNQFVIHLFSSQSYAELKANVTRYLPLNGVVVFSLPEGLWVFCITLTSKPYYLKIDKWRIDCLFIPLIFCVGLEIFQLLHITNGQFDFNDIWVSILFWLIGSFTFDQNAVKDNIFAPSNSKAMVCVATYSIVYLSHVLQ